MNLVPSPCINVCRIDSQRGVCEGCLRTLDEIAAWSRLDDSSKRRIWKLLHERRRAAPDPVTGAVPLQTP
jgi:uncharacterized protein